MSVAHLEERERLLGDGGGRGAVAELPRAATFLLGAQSTERLAIQQHTGRLAHHVIVERAALGGSLLCLVHCLALPIIFAALPALGSLLPSGFIFHLAMLAFAVPASGLALSASFRRNRLKGPLLLGLFGVAFLAAGVLAAGGSPSETPLTVTGAFMLAVAHVANLRRLRKAGLDHA